MNKPGLLIVISGPSGAGKGTICQEITRTCPEIKYSVSATTRAPRAGEIDGVNYFFLDQEQFEKMVANHEFLEWAQFAGKYYGTPKAYVQEMLRKGFDVILEIETQGAKQIREQFSEAVFIFILPPSMEELRARLTKRGTDTPQMIEQRLKVATQEVKCLNNYDYVVVNDEVSKAVEKVKAIITAEKCRIIRLDFSIADLSK